MWCTPYTHVWYASPVPSVRQAKYVGRAYVSPPLPHTITGPGNLAQQLGLLLWQAVEASDVQGALQARTGKRLGGRERGVWTKVFFPGCTTHGHAWRTLAPSLLLLLL